VVDWLSRCYESDFVVNSETGESIRGRYYWAPPGAQTYPGIHPYSSSVWLDPEDRVDAGSLGDQFTNVSKDNGAAPRVRPIAQRFALRKYLGCYQPGDTRLTFATETYGGLPIKCYRDPINYCSAYEGALDEHRKETWCFVAKVLEKLSAGDATVTDLLLSYVPGVELVDVQLDGELLEPRWIAWKATCGRGIIVGGSTNTQQYVMHAFYGSDGPRRVGKFYTNPAWYQQSQLLRETFAAFAGPHRQHSFFAGHSYGGVLAGLMVADESLETNRDEYHLLTLGAPRLGNGEVYRHLSAVHSVFLAHDEDPVPAFPPSYPTLHDLLPIVGPLVYFFYQRWAPPPLQTVLAPDGLVYETHDWYDSYHAAASIAGVIANRSVLPTFYGHLVSSYKARCCRNT